MSNENITYDAIVSEVKNDTVSVLVQGNLNCASCHAKSACGISESEDKKIEIYDPDNIYKINEKVTIAIMKKVQPKAVIYAYLIPFILLLVTLLIASEFLQEWMAGIVAFSVLIPYYLWIYFSDHYFKREFSFSILKNNKQED
ncbi:MAG: SoxR reducing system RseC family protein [Bacteroidota bacterium]